MTTQTIRTDQGYLDTRRVGDRPATRGSGPIRDMLREAGQSLRGAFEAPLRYALGPRADSSLQMLDSTTRRDIGL